MSHCSKPRSSAFRTWTDASGRSADVAFDRAAGPFGRQVAAFGAAVRGRSPWPYPLTRDLALHELLLSSVSPEDPACP